jgi:hypothetical protein
VTKQQASLRASLNALPLSEPIQSNDPSTWLSTVQLLIHPPGASPIELEERALRLPVGRSGEPVIRSGYRLNKPRKKRDQSSLRSLVHQIGNHLQLVRGEVDLLRLSGALPPPSFDTIIQGIENIHKLTVRLGQRRSSENHRQRQKT